MVGLLNVGGIGGLCCLAVGFWLVVFSSLVWVLRGLVLVVWLGLF